MKKTQNILDVLQFIDSKDMSSKELSRLIVEINDLYEIEYYKEILAFEELERDKQESLNSLN